MKKTITISAMLIIAFSAVTTQSCKKSSSSTPAPTTTPPATSVICNGNGTTSYYPLTASNAWHYKNTSGTSYDDTVGATVTFGAFSYFTIVNIQGGNNYYLRKAANGDIMAYDGTGADVLYIPNAPTTNQTWACSAGFGTSRKVVNTNASISTSSCSYTGLLQIQDISSGTVYETFYYKKGIGMVCDIQTADNYRLTSLTLH